jgi:hypothetical protein
MSKGHSDAASSSKAMTEPNSCGHDINYTLLDGSKRCGLCYYAKAWMEMAEQIKEQGFIPRKNAILIDLLGEDKKEE